MQFGNQIVKMFPNAKFKKQKKQTRKEIREENEARRMAEAMNRINDK
jgi:hypothetical protein